MRIHVNLLNIRPGPVSRFVNRLVSRKISYSDEGCDVILRVLGHGDPCPEPVYDVERLAPTCIGPPKGRGRVNQFFQHYEVMGDDFHMANLLDQEPLLRDDVRFMMIFRRTQLIWKLPGRCKGNVILLLRDYRDVAFLYAQINKSTDKKQVVRGLGKIFHFNRTKFEEQVFLESSDEWEAEKALAEEEEGEHGARIDGLVAGQAQLEQQVQQQGQQQDQRHAQLEQQVQQLVAGQAQLVAGQAQLGQQVQQLVTGQAQLGQQVQQQGQQQALAAVNALAGATGATAIEILDE